MRGRKKDPEAVRDGRDPATELMRVSVVSDPPAERVATKPAYISTNRNLSIMWDQLVGDGSAYREQDVPLLTQWVFWTEMASQLMASMTTENGSVSTMKGGWSGDDYIEEEVPQLKQLEKATKKSMELAEHFGGTPMARARLGLTRAATASIGEDIRAKVIAAMREASS